MKPINIYYNFIILLDFILKTLQSRGPFASETENLPIGLSHNGSRGC